MSDFLLSVILGVVEGITEFLPVSSTAHLRIAQSLLGLSLEDEYWKLFAIFIQLGAILSVVVIYREKLAAYARNPFQGPVYRILAAFVCTAAPAFLLKKVIGANLESITVMMLSLAIGGVVMIAVDFAFRAGRTATMEGMNMAQAVFIGFAQVLSAVFPGTSRSMSTIAAGQVVGLTRAAALEFSFLVSIPVMIVATLYDLLKYMKGAPVGLTGHQSAVLAVGFVVSFVVAYAVVLWFLAFVRKHGFLPFGIYRILLAAALFFWR